MREPARRKMRVCQGNSDLLRVCVAQARATIFDGVKPLKMKKWMKSHFIHFVL
jgi:hypothetical protein